MWLPVMTGARFSGPARTPITLPMASIRHGKPQRLHPAHDQVTAHLVLVGERQPRAAAALDGADGRQFVQGAEQAPFIQSQHEFSSGTKTLVRSRDIGQNITAA